MKLSYINFIIVLVINLFTSSIFQRIEQKSSFFQFSGDLRRHFEGHPLYKFDLISRNRPIKFNDKVFSMQLFVMTFKPTILKIKTAKKTTKTKFFGFFFNFWNHRYRLHMISWFYYQLVQSIRISVLENSKNSWFLFVFRTSKWRKSHEISRILKK